MPFLVILVLAMGAVNCERKFMKADGSYAKTAGGKTDALRFV